MKTKILVLLVLLSGTCSMDLFSQTPQWAWARGAGASYGARDVCTDASGCIYMTGSFHGPFIVFGSDTLVNSSTHFENFFLVKYDSLGNVLWARSGGSGGGASGKSIAITKRGIVVAGLFGGSSMALGQTTLTTGPGNNSDMFVARYDSWGNLIWAKAADAQWCFPFAMATDAEGSTYVTGQFGGPISMGSYTLNSSVDNIFLLKLDEHGDALWGASAGNNTNDRGNGVAVGPTGDVYVGGTFFNSLTFDGSTVYQAGQGCDIFVARFTTNGAPVWAKQFGGNNGDCLASLAADMNGNVFLTGSFYSAALTFGSTNLKRISLGDIFVAKLNDQGSALWATSFGGGCASEGTDICVDEAGDAYVTGEYNSSQITFGTYQFNHTAPAPTKMFVVKISRNGMVKWARNAEGIGGYDLGNAVAVDVVGNVYSTGSFYSAWEAFDTDTVTTSGSNDIYLARLKGNVLDRPKVIDVGLSENAAPGVQVFPNPSTSIFNITCGTDLTGKIEVFDAFGRIIKEQAISGSETSIDLGGQAPGLYILVRSGTKNISRHTLMLQ